MKRQRSDPATALLRANLGKALDCLARGGKIDARVHAARKALKRARAALRLMRPSLACEVYEHENRTLRDAAPLSFAAARRQITGRGRCAARPVAGEDCGRRRGNAASCVEAWSRASMRHAAYLQNQQRGAGARNS
jgi:hypothetical protein